MTDIDIIEVGPGIWVIEEEGKNVFLDDCQQFEIDKIERRVLWHYLKEVAQAIREGEEIQPLIDRGILKKLSRQTKAAKQDLWEIRTDWGGARILFIRIDPKLVVVAAVHKSRGSLSHAVNRGVNRWKNYLKAKGK